MLETAEDGWRGRFKAFGVGAEVRLRKASPTCARDVLSLVSDECWRIERAYSLQAQDSIVSLVNARAGHWVETTAELDRLLTFADTCFRLSGGRFDITTSILRHERHSERSRPDLLSFVGWPRVVREAGRVRLDQGMELSLGSLVRGYAVDRALFLARQAHAGDVLVRVGDDVAAVARTEAWQLSDWSDGERAGPAIMELRNSAVASRAAFPRGAGANSEWADLLLDPASGCPFSDAPVSVTVIAPQCTQAGLLAALAMTNGAQAEAFLTQQDVRFWCRPVAALAQ